MVDRRTLTTTSSQVYVDPVVVRLEEELMREENGLWSIAAADRALLGDCPLMHALKHEIQVFADQLKRFGGTIPAAVFDPPESTSCSCHCTSSLAPLLGLS